MSLFPMQQLPIPVPQNYGQTDVNVSDNLTQLLLNLTPKIPTVTTNDLDLFSSSYSRNLERLMSKSVPNYRAQAQIDRFSTFI
ncbi:hypothetical protein FOQG_02659 [Fusarium oxysporum f. sp. raphani 54005]|uniref:Uncharacterized protein n=4 Tax=Fusarium oxysporum TaxID=5507 RepID=X0DT92_FUSOX|nr:hypothetical protein FOVG_07702 [Fusarium oxysporum f. sp. pisi HDV247]EXK97472.1 hypothetical protein FOQG_02659 [Fusarium oxysporum f. sp. raphani 54005]EXL78120.1 hypothetical protein FOPG_07551 [Fusarium oxysporum f. sp. conglutinans race 2 54008]EXM25885.1 hypothetical protein FOTG_07600 [Fusarium oxysporum f. sp. vasinfectum 25433]